MAAHLECWWDTRATVALPGAGEPVAPATGLRWLVSRISAAGLETIVVDLTAPQIRQLGLFVVKALVPGAYPLNFDSRWPHLGGRRLRSAPVTSGLLETPVPFDALNRLPVPFP
jgi:ribosomal protein S12 methylthiotransferase accessory factor